MFKFPTSSPRRVGFTIIELLLVIAIISVLLALGMAGAFQIVETARTSSTEGLLRIVDKSLRTHWKIVVADAKTETPSAAVLSLANGDVYLAQVLWIKLRLAEAFPQSYAEIIAANTLPTTQGVYSNDGTGKPWIEPIRRKYMKTYFDTIKLYNPAKNNPATQSSACLLLALSFNRGNAKLSTGNMGSSLSDTDGDTIMELVDSWSQPLSFQRFPIGNAELAGMNPRRNTANANKGDTLDPDGLLQANSWFTISGPTFTALCGHPFPAGTPQPFWMPFISSNGRDEAAGTGDDILSFRLLKVGAGGGD